MAILTKKEVAARLGIPSNQLAVLIGRALVKNNIILTGEGRTATIDDSLPVNQAFISFHAAKKGIAVKEVSPAVIYQDPKPPDSDKDELEDDSYAGLTKEKLKLQIEELKNKNEKLELANSKTVGNFVPTEHVGMLILQLSEAIHISWENEFEDSLNRIAIKHGLTRLEITELKKEKVIISNLSRVRAVKEAKKHLRRLQNDTSDKRGKGEHD